METVAEALWGLADHQEKTGQIGKAVKCLEAICQSEISFLPIVEVKTRLRIATLLLKHTHNVDHAKSHLERCQLLLKPIPSCFELKCRAYSLLSQCYYLVGAIPSQKQILNKGLALASSSPEGFSTKLWSYYYSSQLANALKIEGDYQGALTALEEGFKCASELFYPELQMFFATSILHVHLMLWDDAYLVERAVNKCSEVWESVQTDKVNRIIKSLCRDGCNTLTIEQLNIVFNMIDDNDKIFQSDIDRWLRFAFQKKVQRLNLDCGGLGFNCYSLIDSEVFRTSSNIGMLRSLSLRNVKVSGEVLEYILTVAPNLEELCVKSGGPSLVSFTVAGPSLKLKHLQLLGVFTVKRLHINNVNLESLHYDGNPDSLIIEKTPSLIEVRTRIFIDFNSFSNFPRMLSKLPQLETLALSTMFVNKSFCPFPKLRNLKRLELDIRSDARCRSLCASLLDASPVLHELKIKLLRNNESREEEETVTALSNPHKGLKVIEVNGFSGCENDVCVVDYLIDNTALIQKMIVDTRVSTGFCSKLNYPKEHEAIRALAKAHLEKRLSAETTTILII